MTTIEKIEKGIITLAEFTEDQQSFIRGIVKLSFNEGQEQALRIHDVSGMLAISALQKIANPIKYLQDEAEKEGARLDGYMAIQLTKDANFYQEIARKALEEIANYR